MLSRRPQQHEDSDAGMTLIELMIVTALLSVVIVATMGFLVSSQRSERTVREATRQQAEARVALDALTRTARGATYPQGYTYNDSSIVAAADKFEVSYYSDIDGDGLVDKVRYYLDTSSGELRLESFAPNCSASPCTYPSTPTRTRVVVDNVRNADMSSCGQPAGSQAPVFRFYKAQRGTGTLTEIATPTAIYDQLVDISFFKVNLALDITPGRSPVCQDVTTSVNIRNWRG